MPVILAADIGGTNCRMGLFRLSKTRLALEKAAWVETGAIAGTDALCNAMERELDTDCGHADAICIAMAGPVQNGCKGCLSNGSLEIDVAHLNQNGVRCFVINDFMGQAYAAVSPEGEKAKLAHGPKQPCACGARAVIGAGTGLGQAMLLPLDGCIKTKTSRWLAAPSENGHSAFPFVNGAENDFHTFLRVTRKIPYATGDETVTGRGLAALHEFLTGEKLTPPEVGARALGSDTETLAWFSRFYARACRNWIFSTLCRGGLWIAGGIAVQNPLVISSRHFVEELYNSPCHAESWSEFLHSVPIYAMEDANSGLWGAARFAQQEVENREF